MIPARERVIEEAEVLAERRYVLTVGEESEEIMVQVALPRRSEEDGRWICRAAVIEESGVSVKPMNGVDAFEAIQLALELIGVELQLILDESRGTLTWLDGRQTGVSMPSFRD